MPAPWIRFPNWPAGHPGWRMGAGESYLAELTAWLTDLPAAERQDWLLDQKPIPGGWLHWAVEWYAFPDGDEEHLDWAREAMERELGREL